jgi:hypothetical protein
MQVALKTITSELAGTTPSFDSLKHTWPALRLALTVLEKTLNGVPIPGLKGAIGGFLELAKTEEVSARAVNRARIGPRRTFAHNYTGVDPELGGYP